MLMIKATLGNVAKGRLQKQSLKEYGQSITHHFMVIRKKGIFKASSVSFTKEAFAFQGRTRKNSP